MTGEPVIATPEDCTLPPGTVLRLDAVQLADGRVKVRCTYTPEGETSPKLFGYIIPRGDMDGDGKQIARRLVSALERFTLRIKTTSIEIPRRPE